MDELEALARRAEQKERAEEEKQAADLEPEAESEAETAPPPEAVDAGANRAEAILRIAEGGVQMFLDDRVALSAEEVEQGRESLGPAIAKHDLAGAGTGNLPYQEEVQAGFFVGRMIKGLIRRLRELRRRDKEKEKQAERERSNGGDQREQPAQEQPRAVSGEVGQGQDSDVAPPITN